VPIAALVAGASAPSFAFDFTTGSLDSAITASGGANGTAVNSSGNIAADTAPRFDYNPATLAALGVLIEGERTNLFQYSADPNNAYWTKFGTATITNDAAASPDGGTNADLVTCSFSSASVGINRDATVATSTPYAVSIYAKDSNNCAWHDIRCSLFTTPSNGGGTLDLTTPSVGTVDSGAGYSGFVNAHNSGWTRAGLLFTTDPTDTAGRVEYRLANADNDTFVSGDDAQYMWGMQLEAGSFASSYIPTTTASLTRTADSLTVTGTNFSDEWSATAGTIDVTFRLKDVSGTHIVCQADDGTANNRITIWTSGTTAKATIVTGGVTQADLSLGTVAADTEHNIVFAWAANDTEGSLDGGAAQTDTSVTLPSGLDNLKIGRDTTGNELYGHVKTLDYTAARL